MRVTARSRACSGRSCAAEVRRLRCERLLSSRATVCACVGDLRARPWDRMAGVSRARSVRMQRAVPWPALLGSCAWRGRRSRPTPAAPCSSRAVDRSALTTRSPPPAPRSLVAAQDSTPSLDVRSAPPVAAGISRLLMIGRGSAGAWNRRCERSWWFVFGAFGWSVARRGRRGSCSVHAGRVHGRSSCSRPGVRAGRVVPASCRDPPACAHRRGWTQPSSYRRCRISRGVPRETSASTSRGDRPRSSSMYAPAARLGVR